MRPDLAKADPELERVEALLAQQERAIQRAFAEFVRDVRSPEVLKEVADLLERGDVEGALRIVDTYIVRMGGVVPQVFTSAATAEATAWTPAIRSLAPAVGIAFDPMNARAAQLAREAQLLFIREFTDAQREAVRLALVEAQITGAGNQATARAFRDAIGLTAYQERVIQNYRNLLVSGNREALKRQLRDRRYDRTVERAVSGGDPLSEQQIDRMVDRYRARMLAFRAEDIARTEGVRITELAREEGFRQTLEQSGLDDLGAEAIWRSVTADRRTRWTHREMNGQVQPMGVPFASPSGAKLRYPGDPQAPIFETAQCRCHRTFRIKPLTR